MNIYFGSLITRSFSRSLSGDVNVSFGSTSSIFLFEIGSGTLGRIVPLLLVLLSGGVVIVDVRLALIRGNVRLKDDERDGKSLIK